jgi:hypothetical protein
VGANCPLGTSIISGTDSQETRDELGGLTELFEVDEAKMAEWSIPPIIHSKFLQA